MLEFRSDAPLPEVPRPFHQIPSAHRPFVDSHPDLVEFDNLFGDDSDGGATLAEDVEGRKGGVDPLAHEGSPGPEAGTIVVPSGRGQLCVRGGLAVMPGSSSSGFCSVLS